MFSSLTAKNFFSWSELKFDFVKGITLISGWNDDDNSSEGSGKSSVINSLSWCLYGQIPAKDINIDEVVKEGTKTCSVEVVLSSGYTIVRTRIPNDLYIIEPNGKRTKGKDMKDTQKSINILLGMSFDTFAQSVFFAQNYNGKFINASQEDKVKVLSELQDLSWCDKAGKRAYDRYKELGLEISKLDYNLKSKQEALSLNKIQLKTFEELDAKFLEDKSEKIASFQAKIDENLKNIKELELEHSALGTLLPLDSHKERIPVLEGEINQLTTLIAHIKVLKDQYEESKHSKECATCGQAILNEVKEPIYPADGEQVLRAIEVRKTELDDLKKNFTDLVTKDSSSKEIKFKINYLRTQNYEIQDQLEKASVHVNMYTGKVEEAKANIEFIENIISSIQIESNNKHSESQSLKILREGFKELKSHVFKSLLTQLNHKANKYIQEFFDVPASINFTNVSEDDEISKIITSVSIDGNERSLGLLSGGQFRRVQIAVDFALSDIVSERAVNPINIRILDEAFKDLSEVKMEKILQILEKMGGCTVIIEHNSLIKSIVNKVFDVRLVNGTSYHS